MDDRSLWEQFGPEMAVMAIEKARRAIGLAQIRLIPFDQLIERLEELPTDS